jgi:hypothetical protein
MVEKALGLPPKSKPKAKAVVNDGEVVRDADVRVSPADPNYRENDGGVVRVRRSDFVTINMEFRQLQPDIRCCRSGAGSIRDRLSEAIGTSLVRWLMAPAGRVAPPSGYQIWAAPAYN